jgi:hypothetical protein
VDRNVSDHGLGLSEAGSSDPLTRTGHRWLGDICAKHMAAWTDTHRQLKNRRASAATNIEYALAPLRRCEIQQPRRYSGDRTIHAHVLVGPRASGSAVPKFDLRRVPCRGLTVCHRGPLELSSIKRCFSAAVGVASIAGGGNPTALRARFVKLLLR